MSDRASRIRARLDARRHVDAIFEAAEEMYPGIVDELRVDAVVAVPTATEVDLVLLTPQQQDEAECSIAGMYFGESVPPRIGVAEAPGPRMRFTVLHEFAHHIQQNSNLADAIADGTAYGRALEERACDEFASRILLPDDEVTAAFGGGTPSATAVRRFWADHRASRAAVCVAAAQHLDDDGYVMVLDATGVVTFASTKGDLPPIRRGSNQAESELGVAIRSTAKEVVAERSRFRFTGGVNKGEELWAQAARAGDYWFVVESRSRVPWVKVALPSFAKRVVGQWWTCEFCGHSWQNFAAPHEACGTPICPECERCSCRLAMKQQVCENCFTEKPIHMFQTGSVICDDCAG
ncbi:ImmA/IrrE family metallo-endopeptidase [Leifsonia aquatica]|uniref:ImmA/IrrE family metallo-endopeptidase n=1 Tax=Leifsonia aquatica TaxID=144185 RepID=UPI0028B1B8BE|nr:ImmA/IrrE family metallo-endopeptidase [Leifsonia aquatica]